GIPLTFLYQHRRKTWALCLLTAMIAGCGEGIPEPIGEPRQPSTLSGFDPTAAGTIQGRVVWQGDVPVVSPLLVRANPVGGDALAKRQVQPNPNAPVIHSTDRGVGNAVVFLRGVDAANAKPWNLPPVRVEQRGLQFHI